MLPKLLTERQRKDGLSNRAVSREIGVSHSTISRALNGDQLDMATLEKFADFLGIPVSSLLDMEGGRTRIGSQDRCYGFSRTRAG